MPTDQIKKDVKSTDWCIVFFTGVLAAASIFQLYVINRQLDEMKNANEEVRKQSKLLRDQLVGSQAAVINITGVNLSYRPLTDNFSISLAFKNDGHEIANNFEIHSEVKTLDLTDGTYTNHQWHCNTPQPVTTFPPDIPQAFPCTFQGLTDEELKSVLDLKRTIAVQGVYTYLNGFGERQYGRICYLFQPDVKTKRGMEGSDQFFECKKFYAGREEILNNRVSGK